MHLSHLQITLLIVGAIVVAGVYVFNVWQERQFRKRVEGGFKRDHDDVLLKGRVEPSLSGNASIPNQAGIATRATPPITPASAASTIDVAIDDVVEIVLETPASGADLYETLRALAAQWQKPLFAEGSLRSAWEPLDEKQAFRRLRFGLQMVNRAGSLMPEQLQTFRDAARAWAQQHSGSIIATEVAEAQRVAAGLDRLCANVDIALGINVVTNHESESGPFNGVAIRDAAQNAGLQLERDGKFYLRDHAGNELFALENIEPALFDAETLETLQTSGITLLLDVPRAADAAQVFERMYEAAQQIAAALNGTLTDDNRVPLSTMAVMRIRQQLQSIVEKMHNARIVAGTARAQRLFS